MHLVFVSASYYDSLYYAKKDTKHCLCQEGNLKELSRDLNNPPMSHIEDRVGFTIA